MHIYVIRGKDAKKFEDKGSPALHQVLAWLHDLGHTFNVIEKNPLMRDVKVGDIYLNYHYLDDDEKDVATVEMHAFDPQRNEMKTIFYWTTTYVQVPWCHGLFVFKRAAERLPTKIHILIDEGAPIQMAVQVDK